MAATDAAAADTDAGVAAVVASAVLEPQIGDRIMVVREPWLGRILHKEKTMEIRNKCSCLGPVWLGFDGHVHGYANITDACVMTVEKFRSKAELHLWPADAAPPYQRLCGRPRTAIGWNTFRVKEDDMRQEARGKAQDSKKKRQAKAKAKGESRPKARRGAKKKNVGTEGPDAPAADASPCGSTDADVEWAKTADRPSIQLSLASRFKTGAKTAWYCVYRRRMSHTSGWMTYCRFLFPCTSLGGPFVTTWHIACIIHPGHIHDMLTLDLHLLCGFFQSSLADKYCHAVNLTLVSCGRRTWAPRLHRADRKIGASHHTTYIQVCMLVSMKNVVNRQVLDIDWPMCTCRCQFLPEVTRTLVGLPFVASASSFRFILASPNHSAMRIVSTNRGCEETAVTEDGLPNASRTARKQGRKKKSQKRSPNSTHVSSSGTGVSSVLDPSYHGLTAPAIAAVEEHDAEAAAAVENRFVALCVVKVPDDGDCLFHALSLFDAGMGCYGYALRNRIAEFMEARAAEQDGFEEAWRLEAQMLRNYWMWGGHTAITAYTLMTGARVMLHIHEADSSSTTVIEASHATVAGNAAAPVKHLLYNGIDHYDALVQVGDLVGLQPAWPQSLPEGNPLPPNPRTQGQNTEALGATWGCSGMQCAKHAQRKQKGRPAPILPQCRLMKASWTEKCTNTSAPSCSQIRTCVGGS